MSRRAAEEEIKDGNVSVNGHVAETGTKVDPASDIVTVRGKRIRYERREYTYIMLNKPRGYLCSTSDDRGRKCVTDLIDLDKRIYPVGRLDLISEGMLLLTDDGAFDHRLMSPKHHAEKEYRVTLANPLSEEDIRALEGGMRLENGEETRPCRVIAEEDRVCRILITEGKYHQVKRMFAAVSNRVTALRRIRIGGLPLDPSLADGEWRELTEEEVTLLSEAN
jgi:pseudouridine synthase